MRRAPSLPRTGAVIPLVMALLLTACQAGASPSAPQLSVASGAAGERVVDAEGRSLYIFLNDPPGESTCTGGCAESWPPALAADDRQPETGAGVTAEVGTIERDDGSLQLTLAGWPLYRYAADSAPGDTSGEGVGEVWYLARPDGSSPTLAQPSAEPSAGYDPRDY